MKELHWYSAIQWLVLLTAGVIWLFVAAFMEEYWKY